MIIIVIVVKYLQSVNLWYTPELSVVYKKTKQKQNKKALRLGLYKQVKIIVKIQQFVVFLDDKLDLWFCLLGLVLPTSHNQNFTTIDVFSGQTKQ